MALGSFLQTVKKKLGSGQGVTWSSPMIPTIVCAMMMTMSCADGIGGGVGMVIKLMVVGARKSNIYLRNSLR